MTGFDMDGDGIADSQLYDTDGDGWADASATDFDGDGIAETELIDVNRDGYFETAIGDVNLDGTADVVGLDTDGDGVMDTAWADRDFDGESDLFIHADDGPGLSADPAWGLPVTPGQPEVGGSDWDMDAELEHYSTAPTSDPTVNAALAGAAADINAAQEVLDDIDADDSGSDWSSDGDHVSGMGSAIGADPGSAMAADIAADMGAADARIGAIETQGSADLAAGYASYTAETFGASDDRSVAAADDAVTAQETATEAADYAEGLPDSSV